MPLGSPALSAGWKGREGLYGVSHQQYTEVACMHVVSVGKSTGLGPTQAVTGPAETGAKSRREGEEQNLDLRSS